MSKKVALCLSGQPRNAIQISERIKKTIINDNDVDVFLHSWYDPNNLNFEKRCPGHWDHQSIRDIDASLLDIYKPKAYLFENPKHWENKNIQVSRENIEKFFPYGLDDPNGIEYFGKYKVDTLHSQWYSNMKVNLIKEEYSITNNIHYDCVIKLRYDVSPTIKLDFINGNFDENILYHQDLKQPSHMVSDWFALGSNKVMNVWSSMYFYIEPLYQQVMSEHNVWGSELLLKQHLANNHVKTQAVDLGIQF
jgi:hypothetical protein